VRVLAFLGVLVLALAGPLVWLTVGRDARADRREHLAALRTARAETEAALAAHVPLPSVSLDATANDLAAREAALGGLLDALVADGAPPPDDERLRALGRDAGVDDALLEPLLVSLTGGDAEAARRRALAGFLAAAAANAPVHLHSLRITVEPAPPAADLRRVTLSARALGPATALVRLVEHVMAGADAPKADLAALEIVRATGDEQDGLPAAWPETALPLRMDVTIDTFDRVGRGADR
jgi:hypothetical protein